MTSWTFLTNHARVLLCIADDPDVRLRDIAVSLGITERRVFGIVTELTDGGYIVKVKEGRRSRYRVRPDMPLPDFPERIQKIGPVLDVLA